MQDKKVAIITGASSGIGKETAIEYARKGYNVVLAARREDKLVSVYDECKKTNPDTSVELKITDVSDESQVKELVNDTVEKFGRLDVMVNNAGTGLYARCHEMTDKELRDIFDINFFGLFYGCKYAANVMTAQKFGHIFNVSSVIGLRGTPFHAGYCATKFAVTGLTDSLRVEMKPYRVKVTNVCPALTATEFFDTPQTCKRKQSKFTNPEKMMHPAAVAKKIVRATNKNKPELVITIGGKFLVLLDTLFPKVADWIMTVYHNDLVRNTKI